MVAAEHAFASLSKTTSTRNAFLNYLTDSTVLFVKGKPVKGKRSWLERNADTALLFWEPVLAGTSANGTMGVSAGPWEWSKGRSTAPEAFGFFVSVWTKRSGSWKLAADIGISFPERYTSRKLTYFKNMPPSKTTSLRSIVEADSIFSNALATNDTQLSSLLSSEALILRDGMQPIHPNEIDKLNTPADRHAKWNQSGCESAENNDFGFCYGTVETPQTGTDTTNRGYLRVLRKDERGDWKVLVDVLSR